MQHFLLKKYTLGWIILLLSSLACSGTSMINTGSKPATPTQTSMPISATQTPTITISTQVPARIAPTLDLRTFYPAFIKIYEGAKFDSQHKAIIISSAVPYYFDPSGKCPWPAADPSWGWPGDTVPAYITERSSVYGTAGPFYGYAALRPDTCKIEVITAGEIQDSGGMHGKEVIQTKEDHTITFAPDPEYPVDDSYKIFFYDKNTQFMTCGMESNVIPSIGSPVTYSAKSFDVYSLKKTTELSDDLKKEAATLIEKQNGVYLLTWLADASCIKDFDTTTPVPHGWGQ